MLIHWITSQIAAYHKIDNNLSTSQLLSTHTEHNDTILAVLLSVPKIRGYHCTNVQ